jgi:hypothetical protein
VPNFIKCLYRKVTKDTSFGYSNQDTMQLENVIAHDLNEMDIWSKKWLMRLASNNF